VSAIILNIVVYVTPLDCWWISNTDDHILCLGLPIYPTKTITLAYLHLACISFPSISGCILLLDTASVL